MRGAYIVVVFHAFNLIARRAELKVQVRRAVAEQTADARLAAKQKETRMTVKVAINGFGRIGRLERRPHQVEFREVARLLGKGIADADGIVR